MKKIFTILGVTATMLMSAQTPLNTNGSLEDWANATAQPNGWFIANSVLGNGLVFKASNASDGVASVGINSQESGYVAAGLADIAITGNKEYTLYYDILDNSTSATLRPWGQWRTASGNITVTDDPFQSNDSYSADNSAWQTVRIVSTSPSTATIFRLTFRNYNQEGTFGGSVYIDNVKFFEGNVVLSASEVALHKKAILNTVWTDTARFKASDANVQIYNLAGQLVKSFNFKGSQDINVSSLNVGVYTVKVTIDGKTSVTKVIKK